MYTTPDAEAENRELLLLLQDNPIAEMILSGQGMTGNFRLNKAAIGRKLNLTPIETNEKIETLQQFLRNKGYT